MISSKVHASKELIRRNRSHFHLIEINIIHIEEETTLHFYEGMQLYER